MVYVIREERVPAAEYIEFLKHTDLGVVRDWVHRGVGTALVRKALEIAGGEKNIIMYTCANEDAVPFYKKLGMTRPNDMMVYDHMDWTPFTVE